ncbi:HNH endonuclease signature motif containing protein [Cellulomonas rhizosphaerae]|nr:HNH endonuclease signature motif containing protein [Cellulomonas rhizosphaerae]
MPENEVADPAALVRAALGVDAFTGSPLQEPAGWDDERVMAGLVAVEALSRHVDLWRVGLVAQVEQRSARGLGTAGLAARRGCRSARELIRRLTGAADYTVSRWLRLGRAIESPVGLTGQPLPAAFPAVAAAVTDGRVGMESALRIIDTLDPVRAVAGDADVAVAEEEIVAGCAAAAPGGVCPADADAVKIQASTWAAFLDQDGAAPPDSELARRSLRLGGLKNGLVRLSGLLMPEVAAALRAFADSRTNPRTPDVPASGDASGDPSGDELDGSRLPREEPGPGGLGREGLQGDGAEYEGLSGGIAGPADDDPFSGEALLAALAARTAPADVDAPGATSGGHSADVPLTEDAGVVDRRTSAQTLHDILAMALGAAARVANQSSLAGNSPTVVVAVRQSDLETGRGAGATLVGGGFGGPLPLSVGATRQLACSGSVQHIALDDLGAVVGLWSAERCFTGPQRRAIVLRDGGCIIPGCQVPAGWCEVHHITPHKDDPEGTHTSNGCLLCWYHHRTIETSGWQIRVRDGIPEVRAPAWLRSLTRAGPPSNGTNDTDDGWQRATGSPTRILDALSSRSDGRLATLAG